MAETKNSFLRGKMNKDIDNRLLPNGEYRDARNIQISRSEGSNVGTLQNVLGTERLIDFRSVTGYDVESIGTYVEGSENNIYIFLTDYTNPEGENVYNKNAYNAIYLYNTLNGLIIPLVEGAFLNFSTTNPIFSVNLLETLLFWTDNRNQPRKINVLTAQQNPGYYSLEEQISVSKLNPFLPINLYKESDIVAASGQYETSMYDVTSEYLPGRGGTASVNVAVTASTTIVIDGFSAGFVPALGQIITGTGINPGTNGAKVTNYNTATNTITVSVAQTLADNTVLTFNANPYYQPDYIGDPNYLSDKFIRFAYRFRFDDGEYSIFSPFTQPAYMPKQDGYFQYFPLVEDDATIIPEKNDESDAYRSTIVSFMENKVNNILLQIVLPGPANQIQSDFKITEVDILYKESDGLSINVVDTLPIELIAEKSGASNVYTYNYQSKKPFKVLPNKDVIRVYDKTPVKAFGQEIISNRVVYSNYQDKLSYPKYLNYNVAYGDKSPFDVAANYTSIVEYPNHTVKQNRTYQVGIVLADRFSRQSGVILSNNNVGSTGVETGTLFGASTLYVPYRTIEDTPVVEWPGCSLKVLFNEVIPTNPDVSTGWPGLWNGEAGSPDYNPLGWYSYKIVVKQTEQDYYNVYLPGLMASYPMSTDLERGKTSHTVLINDNINKVPRDLSEVGPAQLQFRSSVTLFSRVDNAMSELAIPIPPTNVQYYPGNTFSFVNTIATNNSLFGTDKLVPPSPPAPLPAGFLGFYNVDSNPLIGRITTDGIIGTFSNEMPAPPLSPILSVMETSGVESRLDIFWETTSVGIISELNELILAGTQGARSIENFVYTHRESMEPGTTLTTLFYPVDISGDAILDSNISMTVKNTLGTDRSSEFVLVKVDGSGLIPDSYYIKTAPGAYFYYGYSAAYNESYTFKFTITAESLNTIVTRSGSLSNVSPTIDPDNPADIIIMNDFNDSPRFFARNGSLIAGGVSTWDISWAVVSQASVATGLTVNFFSITNSPINVGPIKRGDLIASQDTIDGEYEVTVSATDAGGLTVLRGVTVRYGVD